MAKEFDHFSDSLRGRSRLSILKELKANGTQMTDDQIKSMVDIEMSQMSQMIYKLYKREVVKNFVDALRGV